MKTDAKILKYSENNVQQYIKRVLLIHHYQMRFVRDAKLV